MGSVNDVTDWAGDFVNQSIYDISGDTIEGEAPKKREKRRAKEKAAREKKEARQRIKPIPDPEATKAMERKKSARRAASRKGRASTILSSSEDTLG